MMRKCRIQALLILLVITIVLIIAVLKFVPLKRAGDTYGPEKMTATKQNPATTNILIRQGWFVNGYLSNYEHSYGNIASLYVFEPNGKTLVLSRSYDFQHQTLQSPITFNFTARVEGNYIFLVNATFLYAPPPPYPNQPEVTMELLLFRSGLTSIL